MSTGSWRRSTYASLLNDRSVSFKVAHIEKILTANALRATPSRVDLQIAELRSKADLRIIVESSFSEYDDGVFVLEGDELVLVSCDVELPSRRRSLMPY